MLSDGCVFYECPFCPCVFVCQSDLDLHLKRFGNSDHWDLFDCVSVVFEADAHDAGVDYHAGWHWNFKRSSVSFFKVRKCRKLLDEYDFFL